MENYFCFKMPIFRNGVEAILDQDVIKLQYGGQIYNIEIDNEIKEDSKKLINYLFEKNKKEDISVFCGEKNDLIGFLNDLDNLGLITESSFMCCNEVKTGIQFYREIKRFTNYLKMTKGNSILFDSMLNGSVTKSQMIGYLCEYFHIVYQCPSILSPAINTCNDDSLRDELIKFYVSELNHNKYVEKALMSVGINKNQLIASQPLPWTLGLYSSLSVYASQHLISFICCLELFEDSGELFYNAFKNSAINLGFKNNFYEPILKHAEINNSNSHEDISKLLMNKIQFVTKEDQQITKKNIMNLIDMLSYQDKEVMSYYGNTDNKVPRIFFE